ncbi:energy-coupling factor transporter transmembrane component T family protein [Promicromonospora sp. NPDC060204]|uniref:energy-coupling factor transporter transmembrane component T family protein n=1 Tax=Promicromonospora sp. NPDC060204 TaxID=3347071 RepID=UPI00365E4702
MTAVEPRAETGTRPTDPATAATPYLGRRNPTVKAAILLAASLATLGFLDPRPLLGLWALAVVAVGVAARVPPRTLVLGQVPFVVFGVGLVAVNGLSRPGTPLVSGAPVSVEGLTVGVALALRGLVIGVLTIGFLASTPPRDLMVSLVQHARLSPRYAYPVLAGHRMLTAMPARWATIRAAQAVRAPLRRGRPRFGLPDAGRAAFALLVTSIRSAERIALALESRGLGERPRTVWRPVPIGRADVVLVLVVLAAWVAAAVVDLRL